MLRTTSLTWSQVGTLNGQGKLLAQATTIFTASSLTAYLYVNDAGRHIFELPAVLGDNHRTPWFLDVRGVVVSGAWPGRP